MKFLLFVFCTLSLLSDFAMTDEEFRSGLDRSARFLHSEDSRNEVEILYRMSGMPRSEFQRKIIDYANECVKKHDDESNHHLLNAVYMLRWYGDGDSKEFLETLMTLDDDRVRRTAFVTYVRLMPFEHVLRFVERKQSEGFHFSTSMRSVFYHNCKGYLESNPTSGLRKDILRYLRSREEAGERMMILADVLQRYDENSVETNSYPHAALNCKDHGPGGEHENDKVSAKEDGGSRSVLWCSLIFAFCLTIVALILAKWIARRS